MGVILRKEWQEKRRKIGNDGRQERRTKGRKKEGKSKERIRIGRE